MSDTSTPGDRPDPFAETDDADNRALGVLAAYVESAADFWTAHQHLAEATKPLTDGIPSNLRGLSGMANTLRQAGRAVAAARLLDYLRGRAPASAPSLSPDRLAADLLLVAAEGDDATLAARLAKLERRANDGSGRVNGHGVDVALGRLRDDLSAEWRLRVADDHRERLFVAKSEAKITDAEIRQVATETADMRLRDAASFVLTMIRSLDRREAAAWWMNYQAEYDARQQAELDRQQHGNAEAIRPPGVTTTANPLNTAPKQAEGLGESSGAMNPKTDQTPPADPPADPLPDAVAGKPAASGGDAAKERPLAEEIAAAMLAVLKAEKIGIVADEPLADGPFEPFGFRYGGRQIDRLTPQQHMLATALWDKARGRPRHRIQSEVAEEVSGDPEKIGALKTAASGFNSLLIDAAVPLRITAPGGKIFFERISEN